MHPAKAPREAEDTGRAGAVQRESRDKQRDECENSFGCVDHEPESDARLGFDSKPDEVRFQDV